MGNTLSAFTGGEEEHDVEQQCIVSVEVGPETPPQGETRVRRNPAFADHLVKVPFENEPECNTLAKIFARCLSKFPERPLFGTRKLLPDGQRGDYEFRTYAEMGEDIAVLGTYLNKKFAAKSPVGIFSINRVEWVVAQWALWTQGLVCVPLYDTLGASAIAYIVNHTELTTVFCNPQSLDKLLKEASALKSLRSLIVFEAPTEEQTAAIAAAGWTVELLQDIIASTPKPYAPPADVQPQDLAYIMYTSGTTGDPKGVLLSQGSLLASCAGLMRSGFNLNQDDCYLSYLPLAHSFEACLQVVAMTAGGSIGFYQGDAKLLIKDVHALRPTIFAGVPRVYARIYDSVNSVVSKSSYIKKTVFHHAFQSQLEYVRVGQRNALLDTLVFNKVAQQLGGRVRIMATGAAPMPAFLMDFLKVAFKCGVYQGYGMTENAAAAMVTPPGYCGVGTVGGPLPCTEVKLMDVPEMGYLAANDPPGGEVCLRGPNVFEGYYKLEKETKEALDADGWLHTGDIGIWEADTSLRIVDRKKNIFKLAQGEFVAAEELENIFSKSKYIFQIWVYGDSMKVHLVAVIVPNQDNVMHWASENNIEGDFKAVCATPQLRQLLLTDLQTMSKQAKLAGFKVPKNIYIESEVNSVNQGFTVETDTLTPTFKLRRPQLLKRYKAQIDKMYADLDTRPSSSD